jgi:hypothetical protein
MSRCHSQWPANEVKRNGRSENKTKFSAMREVPKQVELSAHPSGHCAICTR